MPTIYWTLKRRPDGWEGRIYVQLNPGAVDGGGAHIAVARSSDKGKPGKAKAIGKAAIVAEKLLNAAENDPIARALLPPGAGAAIEGVKAVAKSHAVGRAMEAVEHFGGSPSLRRLASIL